MSDATPPPPRAFISYSWTNEDHKERILDIARRLTENGVYVVLDRFELREGDDKFAFMERMVTDPLVTHVLMFCDKRYSEKADGRAGGVGTESQIISQELYSKTKQSKFIPIACERDGDGGYYLPTFSKSRIVIDFSSPELESLHWEQLIRLLYNKPMHSRPPLGRAPLYITQTPSTPPDAARTRYEALRQAFLAGKPSIAIYREDFFEACLDNLRAISGRTRPKYENALEAVLDECSVLTPIRDYIVEWILLEFTSADSAKLVEELADLINGLRDRKNDELIKDQWKDHIVEAREVIIHEIFLYSVAALLKRKAYGAVRSLYDGPYHNPRWHSGEDRSRPFEILYKASDALGLLRAENGQSFNSPGGERMRRSANRKDISFLQVIQADILSMVVAEAAGNLFWYPQTAVYLGYDYLPLFDRWTHRSHFGELALIVGIPTADDLRAKLAAVNEGSHMTRWHQFGYGTSFERATRLKELGTK